MAVRSRALAVACALAACADVTGPPPGPQELLGTPLGYTGGTIDLTWIPGTRRVAFRAPATDTTTCAIRTIDVDSGRVGVLDDDCVTLAAFTSGALRGLATSYDGAVVAWQVGVAGADPLGGAVRAMATAAPAFEYRRASRLWPAVAISRDGRSLAFGWSLNDTLVVRDLLTGDESRIEAARPIAFSPTGLELAYLIGAGAVRRRIVGDVTESVVRLSLTPGDILGPMYWDVTGLWAVVDRLNGGVFLRNTETGAEVLAAPFDFGKSVRHPSWSPDGRRFAYWAEYCTEAPLGTPCTVESATLVVVDRDTGTRVTAASGASAGGPIALSPDGTEVVYGFGGALYRSTVVFPPAH